MVWTLVAGLAGLWGLCLASGIQLGGYLHVLLMAAIVLAAVWFIKTRRLFI